MKRLCAILIANLSVFFFLVEFSSRVFLIDLVLPTSEPIVVEEDNRLVTHINMQFKKYKTSVYRPKVPHPYFGFIYETDNFESHSYNEEFDDAFKVGLFGGSVGTHVFNANKKSKSIQKLISKELGVSESKVKVIQFATSAYKQPQHLNVATLYGSNLDLAINIEGSNEMTYYYKTEFPFYYPVTSISRPFFSSIDQLALIPKFMRLAEKRGTVATRLIENKYSIATSRLWDSFLYKYFHTQSLNMSKAFDKKRHSFFSDSEEVKYDPLEKLRFWLKMSCLQQNTMHSFGVNNFFYIQPLPYLFKDLTAEEKLVIGKINEKKKLISKFLEGVDFDSLSESGLRIKSLLRVFQDSNKSLYTDSCCHMTDEGNDLLLNSVLSDLKIRLNDKPKRCDLKVLLGEIDKLG